MSMYMYWAKYQSPYTSMILYIVSVYHVARETQVNVHALGSISVSLKYVSIYFQCLSCGPGNTGQCIGPNICCGAFGCYFGTPEAHVCAKENDSSTPCQVNGGTCGTRGQGNCVSDGVCCDECKFICERGRLNPLPRVTIMKV